MTEDTARALMVAADYWQVIADCRREGGATEDESLLGMVKRLVRAKNDIEGRLREAMEEYADDGSVYTLAGEGLTPHEMLDWILRHPVAQQPGPAVVAAMKTGGARKNETLEAMVKRLTDEIQRSRDAINDVWEALTAAGISEGKGPEGAWERISITDRVRMLAAERDRLKTAQAQPAGT